MRYVRYTAYVCMFGRRGKGAGIPLMGVRFFEIAIPLSERPPPRLDELSELTGRRR